jgi:hypothetical protein
VTGLAKKNGARFKGTYAIQSYVVHNHKVYAVGTLSGLLGKHHVTSSGVMMPASLTKAASKNGAKTAQASCTILHLDLMPIHLNLLGLQVTTSEIIIDVTAVQGPNNLLGNLLCSLTGLLNQGGALSTLAGELQQLAATLTSLSSLLGSL